MNAAGVGGHGLRWMRLNLGPWRGTQNGFKHFSPDFAAPRLSAESRLSIFNAIMSRRVWPNVPVDWLFDRLTDWLMSRLSCSRPSTWPTCLRETLPWASGTSSFSFAVQRPVFLEQPLRSSVYGPRLLSSFCRGLFLSSYVRRFNDFITVAIRFRAVFAGHGARRKSNGVLLLLCFAGFMNRRLFRWSFVGSNCSMN